MSDGENKAPLSNNDNTPDEGGLVDPRDTTGHANDPQPLPEGETNHQSGSESQSDPSSDEEQPNVQPTVQGMVDPRDRVANPTGIGPADADDGHFDDTEAE